MAGAAKPIRVNFHRTKYGRELLVDAAYLSQMPAFNALPAPHTLGFYDILLVTRGRGTFWLDDASHAVAPGVMFFTRPGQIRRWNVEDLDGACLFFTDDFVREVFSDARFLEQFAFFRPEAAGGALPLSSAERSQFLRRFSKMSKEFRVLQSDAQDLLRAILYELLVLLNRWYRARYAVGPSRERNETVDRFQTLVDRDFRHDHRVAEYADRLGVTPGHLNALCRQHLGHSASAQIRRRITIEAKRLLLYTTKTAYTVADELGFVDAAYFGRFFRREAGTSPRQYRTRQQQAGGGRATQRG